MMSEQYKDRLIGTARNQRKAFAMYRRDSLIALGHLL